MQIVLAQIQGPTNNNIIAPSKIMGKPKFIGAGGTPGGVGLFFIGLAMAAAGGWALTNQVTVSDGFFSAGFLIPVIGYQVHSFGLSLVPFIVGIAFLFFDAKSMVGWILSVAGFAIIIAGILLTLHIQFRPTTLFNTLVMLVLLFGGVGLILRSFKSALPETDSESPPKSEHPPTNSPKG